MDCRKLSASDERQIPKWVVRFSTKFPQTRARSFPQSFHNSLIKTGRKLKYFILDSKISTCRIHYTVEIAYGHLDRQLEVERMRWRNRLRVEGAESRYSNARGRSRKACGIRRKTIPVTRIKTSNAHREWSTDRELRRSGLRTWASLPEHVTGGGGKATTKKT